MVAMGTYEQYRLVDLIHDMHVDGGVPSGLQTRYVWSWTFNRTSCTRAVNAGKKYGYLDGHYPSHGFASMNLTKMGREYAEEIVKTRAARRAKEGLE